MAAEMPNPEHAPAVNFTPAAAAKLTEVLASNGPLAALRLQIVGRMGGEFQHALSLVETNARPDTDLLSEADGLPVFIEARSAAYLDGVQIDYEYRGPEVSGLKYRNPNPLWHDEREVQIQEIFDTQINPAIASHGGWVSLLGVEESTAFVQLGGGCQGCGMADVTLSQGIEATILDEVAGIDRVVDQTEHDAGQNPYYQPSKK
jgi:Fe/S biogenesis protein NfuA